MVLKIFIKICRGRIFYYRAPSYKYGGKRRAKEREIGALLLFFIFPIRRHISFVSHLSEFSSEQYFSWAPKSPCIFCPIFAQSPDRSVGRNGFCKDGDFKEDNPGSETTFVGIQIEKKIRIWKWRRRRWLRRHFLWEMWVGWKSG